MKTIDAISNVFDVFDVNRKRRSAQVLRESLRVYEYAIAKDAS